MYNHIYIYICIDLQKTWPIFIDRNMLSINGERTTAGSWWITAPEAESISAGQYLFVLVMTNSLLLNMAIYSEPSLQRMWLSIVMLVYQRVFVLVNWHVPFFLGGYHMLFRHTHTKIRSNRGRRHRAVAQRSTTISLEAERPFHSRHTLVKHSLTGNNSIGTPNRLLT